MGLCFDTSFCRRVGIELPIVQAPVGNITTPALAAAVSNGGGLGMLSITWREPDALAALLGKDAPNLSPGVISRLTAEWQADYDSGRSATSQHGDTCTCGRTGSTCRPGWKTAPNACWC